ncbi:MAG: hypothetical protein LW606_03255 [Ilumatobacteraceae bacterium]|jgi:hypothetical protein|nr:hypothetical protein [Ilumatobacteraceae bacterium]
MKFKLLVASILSVVTAGIAATPSAFPVSADTARPIIGKLVFPTSNQCFEPGKEFVWQGKNYSSVAAQNYQIYFSLGFSSGGVLPAAENLVKPISIVVESDTALRITAPLTESFSVRPRTGQFVQIILVNAGNASVGANWGNGKTCDYEIPADTSPQSGTWTECKSATEVGCFEATLNGAPLPSSLRLSFTKSGQQDAYTMNMMLLPATATSLGYFESAPVDTWKNYDLSSLLKETDKLGLKIRLGTLDEPYQVALTAKVDTAKQAGYTKSASNASNEINFTLSPVVVTNPSAAEVTAKQCGNFGVDTRSGDAWLPMCDVEKAAGQQLILAGEYFRSRNDGWGPMNGLWWASNASFYKEPEFLYINQGQNTVFYAFAASPHLRPDGTEHVGTYQVYLPQVGLDYFEYPARSAQELSQLVTVYRIDNDAEKGTKASGTLDILSLALNEPKVQDAVTGKTASTVQPLAANYFDSNAGYIIEVPDMHYSAPRLQFTPFGVPLNGIGLKDGYKTARCGVVQYLSVKTKRFISCTFTRQPNLPITGKVGTFGIRCVDQKGKVTTGKSVRSKRSTVLVKTPDIRTGLKLTCTATTSVPRVGSDKGNVKLRS